MVLLSALLLVFPPGLSGHLSFALCLPPDEEKLLIRSKEGQDSAAPPHREV